jgi:tetratricopeptide (TPR) repeat protein
MNVIKSTPAQRRAHALRITLINVALTLTACDASVFANADKLKVEARQTLEAKNFSDAGKAAQKLIDKAPDDYEGYYLLAQAKAQTGDKNAAIVALEQAIKKGLKDDAQIDKNSNLDPIKPMVAYGDLMKASFPGRNVPAAEAAVTASNGSASVSITESGSKQVLRAGNVVIEVPSDNK